MAEKHLKNKNGQQIYVHYWNKDNRSTETYKGLIFIAHGYCEHCLGYTELAEFLIQQGYYVFSHDHVGHGKSEGDRAHVTNFDKYVEDVLQHIDHIRNRYPNKPVFLIGHSMGGAIAVMAAMARPTFFTGVVLIGPLIMPDPRAATPFRLFMGKVLAMVRPQMHIAKLEPTALTRNKEFVKEYINDPLVYHNGIKCRWAVAMLDALKRIKDGMSDIDWPFFILHGSEDALCALEGSRYMYETARSTDKKHKVFEGAFHQLHQELEPVKKETFDLIAEWVNSRVAGE